ncbi:proline-rich transmembrane protein 4 [Emydura macquarii macquarii]|uniref:proline-rich transmembrane protein 4 n=1 Tax=Emydura macquarii macquarii TaxID=1129001 RepID=UPI00352A8F8D
MWALLAVLCLTPPDSSAPGVLAEMHQTPAPAGAGARARAQGPSAPQGALRKAPLTASELPARGQDPVLSLNLGLNFKIKVRSQGSFRPASPSPEPALADLPPADMADLIPSTGFLTPANRFRTELLPGEALPGPPSAPGSGWLGTGSADEPSPEASQRGPGSWAGSPAPRFRSSPGGRLQSSTAFESEFLELAPTAQLSSFPPGPGAPPEAMSPAARQPSLAGSPRGRSKELEFKINIDLTAGLDQEMGAPPTGVLPARGGKDLGTRRKYPLIPGLKAGISELASKLGTSSFFGPTLPPDWRQERRVPEERNSTRSLWDQPRDTSPSPPRATKPGPVPGRHGSSAGSEGALAAWPRCSPEKPEECGSPSPEPEAPPVPHLLPSPPLFVTLHADWNTAMADWGLAWEAHVYGAGSLFSLLVLLSLLSLACLPFRCPAGSSFLVALDLLLLVAGAARAFLLFYDAYGQQERLPAFASLLLHDLPFPCLSSALAVAFLLLASRSRLKLSRARCRQPAFLAALVLLHFFVAVGAVLAVDLLRQFPFLLLVSRGAFALLAALLSLAFLGFYCLGRADALQIYDLKSSAEPPGRCPFADARGWRRAARTALLAACFALLSAGLQAYTILHALGYGLPPGFFGPWPWWSLQLGCRLCEVGAGLPLALVGLYPVLCSQEEPCPRCWGALFRLPPAPGPMKGPVLPQHFTWAVSQREKLVICDTIARSEAEFLPLYALAEDVGPGDWGHRSPGAAGASETRLQRGRGSPASSVVSIALDGDPTADFRPPSPIDLRRSIDEALAPASLFHAAGALAGSSSLSLGRQSPLPHEGEGRGETPAGRGLCRTSSCGRLETALPEGRDGEGDVSPDTSAPDTPLSSPGPWRGSSCCSGSPDKLSLDGSSQALCSSHAPAFAYQQKLPRGPGENSPCRSPPPPGGPYLPLAQASQESLDRLAQPAGGAAVLQEEFTDVCRQIDALSVSSDTIEL